MNIAVIMASGSGTRMKQDIPKQFINVNDKPILIYTLEKFQNHSEIDKIMVVCLPGWEDMLKAYSNQFGISKLKWIVTGGSERQQSILNGLEVLKKQVDEEDFVILHDGVRPLVSEKIITSLIDTATQYGNAVSSIPIIDQVVKKEDEISTKESIPRNSIRVVTTPQAYKLSKIVNIYEKAFADNIGTSGNHSINTLMHEYGEKLYFSSGSVLNIKITSIEDIDFFKAQLSSKRSDWIKTDI